MTISSRTPEGDHFECDICRKTFYLSVSTFPSRDVTCPHCGCLSVQELFHYPPTATRSLSQSLWTRLAADLLSLLDIALWLSFGVGTSLSIHYHDGTWFAPFVWLVAILAYGFLFLPFVELQFADLPDHGKWFWLAVALGWSLVAGVPTGVLVGAMIPLYENLQWSSNVGACIGLILGPLMAAMLGLMLAGTLNVCLWVSTGRSLAEKPR